MISWLRYADSQSREAWHADLNPGLADGPAHNRNKLER